MESRAAGRVNRASDPRFRKPAGLTSGRDAGLLSDAGNGESDTSLGVDALYPACRRATLSGEVDNVFAYCRLGRPTG